MAKEKATPDWKKEALALVVLLRAKCSDEEWANLESRFACTAPAPQPADLERDLYALLRGICEDVIDWMTTLSYDNIGGKEVLDHPLTKEIRLKLQRMYDVPLDNKLLMRTDQLERILDAAATPQVTPTQQRYPNATPYTIRQEDGTWIAHALAFDLVGTDSQQEKAVKQLRTCLIAQIAFGIKRGLGVSQCFFPAPTEYWQRPCEFMPLPTEEEIAKCKFEGTSEQASPTPEKCPSCFSGNRATQHWPCAKRYGGTANSWHSSAATPPRNTGISLDGGKTIQSKFKND